MRSSCLCEPLQRLPPSKGGFPLGFEQEGRNHPLPWQVRRAVLEFIRELLSSVGQSCWAWDVVGHIFTEFSRTSGRLVSAEQDTQAFDRCMGCAESSCRHPWPRRAHAAGPSLPALPSERPPNGRSSWVSVLMLVEMSPDDVGLHPGVPPGTAGLPAHPTG